jgi:hypothetical protein
MVKINDIKEVGHIFINPRRSQSLSRSCNGHGYCIAVYVCGMNINHREHRPHYLSS